MRPTLDNDESHPISKLYCNMICNDELGVVSEVPSFDIVRFSLREMIDHIG
jgi:hypothetical protein